MVCELAGCVESDLAVYGVGGISFGAGLTMLAGNGGVSERVSPIDTGGDISGTARFTEAINPGKSRSNMTESLPMFSQIQGTVASAKSVRDATWNVRRQMSWKTMRLVLCFCCCQTSDGSKARFVSQAKILESFLIITRLL